MHLQKVMSKKTLKNKLFFVGILSDTEKIRIRICKSVVPHGSKSVLNVTDPQHWLILVVHGAPTLI
jgi:hypothetical protein